MFGKLKRIKWKNFQERRFCDAAPKGNAEKLKFRNKRAKHSYEMGLYFQNNSHLNKIEPYIPKKYFLPKNVSLIENLYLVDSKIARRIALQIIPYIQDKQHLVCETNAGLGLIASELLDTSIGMVRLYESCVEFRHGLRDFNRVYPNRVELFSRDLFQLSRFSYIDKCEGTNHVGALLDGVPIRDWSDDPAITIIGAMPKAEFITYLIRMMALNAEIISHGRVQLFLMMRPTDYIKLTAEPPLNLHTYQRKSVLFGTLFDYRLIEKLPRNAFLPWEIGKSLSPRTRYSDRIDRDKLYLVHITCKKKLPVRTEDLLAYYFFVKQFFAQGSSRVIPTIEKWIPNAGLNFFLPTKPHKHYFTKLNNYTTFGELKPQEILTLFSEMIVHPGYEESAFASMVQSELLKYEVKEEEEEEVKEEMNSIQIEDLNSSQIVNALQEKLDLD